jgi:glycerophosphoryl diester phosphodiesterase
MIRIGHRGACGYQSENTVESFQKALELGVDMIECDLWHTKDKKIVIIHDHNVNRTTFAKGAVKKYTLAEIKQLKIRGNHGKIPALEELLDLAKNRCQLNLEIKNKKTAKYLMAELKNSDFPLADIMITSKHLPTLKYLKEKMPDIKIGYVYKPIEFIYGQVVWALYARLFWFFKHRLVIRRLKKFNINILNIYYLLVTKKFIKKIHELNKQIFVWTLNSNRSIKRMKKIGVDGITSNFPDRL